MARRKEASLSTQEAQHTLELDSGADIYLEESSSEDEDLLTQLYCSYAYGESDPDYIPPESDDDMFESASLTVTSKTQLNLATPRRTPRIKRRRASSAQSDSDAPVRVTTPKRKAKQVRDASTSTVSVKEEERRHDIVIISVKVEESDSDSPVSVTTPKTKAKHFRDVSTSTVSVKEEEEEGRWHDKDEKDTRPNLVRFMPARAPGPTLDTTVPWSPLSLFRLFFSSSAVRTIIENTNAHADKRQQAGLKFKWTPLTDSDFWIFMSVVLFTGLVSVHQRSDYWRKEWPYGFSFPRNRMTRERFEAILFSLHLSNPQEDEENNRKRNTAEYDRLFKIKPLYTEMVSACQAHFQPYRNICIDERMVASKARISMKHGYKVFVLADAQTAYTFNFSVYQGKSTTVHSLDFSSVWDLLSFQTLGGGYTLYVHNSYTSPALFEELSKKNIGCCGTIKTNRIGYPKTEVNNLPKNAERGDVRWIRRGKLLFVKWKDTREVNMCSTVHEAFTGQTVKRRVKEAGKRKVKDVPVPSAVLDYNRFMGSVDLSDTLIKSYSVHHKTKKWYKTFFYHFIDVAVVNSFILHKELCRKKNEKPYTQKIFREKLAKEMLDFGVGSAPPEPPPVTCMPMFYGPDDIEGDDKRKYCQRCNDAGRKRVKTPVYCRKCQVPLCFVKGKNCFVEWHDAEH